MPKPLVIVESPAKAKTIAGFLGSGYMVESSIGHIRDLPSDASDIPASMKGESWARLGVDVDNGFKPLYVVVPGKRERVSKLRALLKDASELYLATDEDREGESIAWHLLEVLNPRVPVKRMVFHEITRGSDPAGGRQLARARPAPGRRSGDEEDPRPAVRLRSKPRPVAQSPAPAFGRTGAVGGHPFAGRAGAGQDALQVGLLLGYRRAFRPGRVTVD